MNASSLAQAVVHWLEFERLCERNSLFSEAALRQPIGQYLKASQSHAIIPEKPYPLENVTKPKALDFCLKRRGGNAILHAIECKWVAGNRDFTNEFFSDIYRLQHLSWPNQAEPCQRWLIVAGTWRSLQASIFNKTTYLGAGKVPQKTFDGILSVTIDTEEHHHIYTFQNTAPKPILERWCAAALKLNEEDVVSSIRTKLAGKCPDPPVIDGYACLIWRVVAPQGQGFKPIAEVLANAA